MRKVVRALAVVLLLTGCADSDAWQPSAEAFGGSSSTVGSLTAQQNADDALDFAVCRAAHRATQDWSSALIVAGVASSALTDLAGPGLIDLDLQDPGALQANSNLLDGFRVFVTTLGALNTRSENARYAANACAESQALAALPNACQQAITIAASPNGASWGAWGEAALVLGDAFSDAVQSFGDNLRVQPIERAAFISAERRLTAATLTMTAQAEEIQRLASICVVP